MKIIHVQLHVLYIIIVLYSFTKNNISDEGGCMLAEVLKATQSIKQMRYVFNIILYIYYILCILF